MFVSPNSRTDHFSFHWTPFAPSENIRQPVSDSCSGGAFHGSGPEVDVTATARRARSVVWSSITRASRSGGRRYSHVLVSECDDRWRRAPDLSCNTNFSCRSVCTCCMKLGDRFVRGFAKQLFPCVLNSEGRTRTRGTRICGHYHTVCIYRYRLCTYSSAIDGPLTILGNPHVKRTTVLHSIMNTFRFTAYRYNQHVRGWR